MLRLLLSALLFLGSAGLAPAQLSQTHAGKVGAGVVFSGPCDQAGIGTPKLFYGLRGCGSAYATGSNPAINVRRASDNTTQDINILSNGNLDVAGANTFATQDATASCTIASSTATCSGASSTPHVGSTITGAGLTQPCFASAVGTFTGGSGTVTVSNGGGSTPCGTVGVAETLTFQYGLYVTKIYDQSGNGNICTGSVHCDGTQGTNANQPQLFPLCPTLPCLHGDGAAFRLQTPQVTTGSAQPFTMTSVELRLGTGGAYGYASRWGPNPGLGASTNAAKANMYAGTLQDFTASDNASHVLVAVFNGASSIGSTDNTNTTTNPGSTAAANGQQVGILSADTAQFWFNGYWMELGYWFVGFTTGQITTYCHNAFTYWGTSTSC